jgi:hypothetical protein
MTRRPRILPELSAPLIDVSDRSQISWLVQGCEWETGRPNMRIGTLDSMDTGNGARSAAIG